MRGSGSYPARNPLPGKWKVFLLLSIIVAIASGLWIGHEMTRKTITISVDKRKTTISTFKTTVHEALVEAKVKVKPADRVEPIGTTALQMGMIIRIYRAVPVVVKLQTKTLHGVSAADSVAGVLKAFKVQVYPNDLVYPSLQTKPYPGLAIRVKRIKETTKTVHLAIAFTIEKRQNSNRYIGSRRVLRTGRNGKLEKIYALQFEDGKIKSKVLLKKKRISEPVAAIIEFGTKLPVRTVMTSRGLRRYTRLITVRATAYSPNEPGLSHHTATGRRAEKGVIAVDPDVIPLGTRVYIPGYGLAIAADTGGAINGRRIDLCYDSLRECYRFATRRVKVYILED